PWELFRLPPPTGAEVGRLLDLKAGANYLGMSYVLPFLDAVRARRGSYLVFFTGDQGDKILGDVTPVTSLRADDALVEYILRKESVLPPEPVAHMTGMTTRALADRIRRRIESYPERTPAQRYVHFLFAERAVRWLFEGEDRNRCYFWHATPF